MIKPILVHYTIRSKQAFIFRTNMLAEIRGGSKLIANAWNELFDAAEKAGLKVKRLDDNDFSFPDTPEKAFENEDYDMIDLFRGGGNDTVLFRNEECMKKANAAFTRRVFEYAPGMIPLCVGVETTENYRKDWDNLMDAVEREKNRMQPGRSTAMMPFSMMDRKTFQPIEDWTGETERSAEQRKKKEEAMKENVAESERGFSKLIESKEKSLLAVIHADGNNMGKKIITLLGNRQGYSECVELMRKFTKVTDAVFTGPKAKANIEAHDMPFSYIIDDGDDLTIVCEAKNAEIIASSYLRYVSEQEGVFDGAKEPIPYSSCAGICIFHNKFPFSEAYSLAEDACKNAKSKVHVEGEPPEEAWIDFHFIHSGVSGKLETIRKKHDTEDDMARPLFVCENKNKKRYEVFSVDNMYELHKHIGKGENKISRSNLKTVAAEWENNHGAGEAEMERVYGRNPGLWDSLSDIFGKNAENVMKALYDMAEVYDIDWFEEA